MDCWITGLHIAYTACKWEDVNRNIDIAICNRYLVVFWLINQSIKPSKRHTSTKEATSQRNHTGSKLRDAKRRRLGELIYMSIMSSIFSGVFCGLIYRVDVYRRYLLYKS